MPPTAIIPQYIEEVLIYVKDSHICVAVLYIVGYDIGERKPFAVGFFVINGFSQKRVKK